MGLAEVMANKQKKNRTAPRLWVRRFVLYKHIGQDGEPPEVIRDERLYRGLNIIQGIEASELPQKAKLKRSLTGHAVGKTLFCRLIRHGLGEHRYGTPAQKARIEKTFPDAWLGLEVVLDDEPWAILRQIGSGKNSYSAEAMTLEELLPSVGRKEYQGLDEWRESLGEKLTKNIRGFGPEAQGATDRWLRLLCWCARDQETRFRKLWKWRSTDSESNSPNILKPEAYRLIKGTLGLLNQKGAKLEEELQSLTTEISELENEITSLRREPGYRLNWCQEQIDKLEAKYEGEELKAARIQASLEIFEGQYPNGLLAKVIEDRLKLAEQVAYSLRMQLAAIDGELLATQQELEEHQRAWDRISDRVSDDAEAYAKEHDAKSAERQALVEKVRKLRTKYCLAGKILIRDCSYYKMVLAEAKDGVVDLQAEKRAREEKEFAESRKPGGEASRKEKEEIEADIQALRQARLGLSADVSDAEKQASELERDYEQLLTLLAQQQEAARWDSGDIAGSPLAAKIDEKREKEKRKTELEKQRTESLSSYTKRRDNLTAIFNDLVKEVVGETFQGNLRISEEDLAFEITEEEGLHSEAVDTLANLLSDTTVLLASIMGIGEHPRFLLHDSPREGDLDRMLYEGFLGTLHNIHTTLGGQDEAPFQYIITTTTTPPKKELDLVRMQLCSWPRERMLFKRALGEAGTTIGEQKPFFDHNPHQDDSDE
jgi:hypothetical protein